MSELMNGQMNEQIKNKKKTERKKGKMKKWQLLAFMFFYFIEMNKRFQNNIICQ